MTDDGIKALARHYVETKRGIGMTPPFYAETASVKGDQDWPLWIVRNGHCNSLGGFMSRELAGRLAPAMNEAFALTGKHETGGAA